MSANQELFHRIAQVRNDVPPIRHLCCLRGSTGGSIDIRLPAISTHNLHLWVCSQPPANALCFAISKQIHNFVRLQVHENAAKALATSPTSGKGNDVTIIPSPKNCTGGFLHIQLKPFVPPVWPDAVSPRVKTGYELVDDRLDEARLGSLLRLILLSIAREGDGCAIP